MRMSSVEYRLGKFLETDWKLEASKLLEERKASGEGSVSSYSLFNTYSSLK